MPLVILIFSITYFCFLLINFFFLFLFHFYTLKNLWLIFLSIWCNLSSTDHAAHPLQQCGEKPTNQSYNRPYRSQGRTRSWAFYSETGLHFNPTKSYLWVVYHTVLMVPLYPNRLRKLVIVMALRPRCWEPIGLIEGSSHQGERELFDASK